MKKSIRQLREERGESAAELAQALRISTLELNDLEAGVASPSVVRLKQLTRHFGVDETEIDLEPYKPPSLGEQIVDAISGE